MQVTTERGRSALGIGSLSDRAPIRHLDPVLLVTTFLLTLVGTFAIFSATHQVAAGADPWSFVKKQILAWVIAAVVLGAVAVVDYRLAKVYAPFLYAATLVLLLLVRTPLGTAAKGAQRGFYIAGFQFTPSEWTKVTVAIMLAAFLSELKTQDLSLRDLIRASVIALIPMVLVFIQPDIGTTIVLAAILGGIAVVAGAKTRHIAVLMAIGILLIALAFQVGLIKQYQIDRLTGFTGSGTTAATYNQKESEITVGSGGWSGTGYLHGTQTNLNFVPEQHTDFIFTVIGEEFGFVGAAVLLVLYALLLWRAIRIAALSKDRFGTYLAAGIASMFAIQMFVNIGMTVGIMPITGIPLPFVSYGGSSLVASYVAVGLLLNIHMRRLTVGAMG
ncbi:MAG TPA: rod shape-determining protein RodA [Actinomycetota bacterium]